MRKVLVYGLLLFSASLFGQNLPTSTIWGNLKLQAFTSAQDTSGFASLDQLKTYINTGTGSGTVTSVSVASANGFAGTVATATTTPAITVSTTVTGVLKGNGTAISAATSGTDYSAGTSASATGYVRSTTGTGALTTVATIPTTDLSGTISNAQLTNSNIALATGTTGSDINWSAGSVALGGTATINVPDATGANRGVVTVGTQTFGGAKTFNSSVTASGALTASAGATISGNYVETTGAALTGATTLTTSSNKQQFLDATSAAFTVTLPTTPTSGTQFVFTKTNTTANYVTISRGGTNTINGNTTHVIVSASNPTIFTFNGTNWYVAN